MRVLVVVNTYATAHDPRVEAELVRALSREHDVELAPTAHRGNGVDLAAEAAAQGFDAVVAYGGDGTVNEVINGVLRAGPGPDVPAVGVIPAGSTNVFVRALGLPNDPARATTRLAQALARGSRRPVSLGLADDRWFCFSAGLGFDAAIVHAVEESRRGGRKSTHALYTALGLREFFTADRSNPRARVELPDGTVLWDLYFTIVTNCDPWTFVGPLPLRPTPHTTFETGLGLYARRRMGTAGMVFSMGRLMGPTAHVGSRGAALVEDLERLTVLADEPLPFQIDGDAVDTRSKVSFRSVPAAVQIVM
jgi:diacylglycerol kinase family enzyme